LDSLTVDYVSWGAVSFSPVLAYILDVSFFSSLVLVALLLIPFRMSFPVAEKLSPNHGAYALITGGSTGIGFAMAHVFARNGFNLILVASNQDRLEKAAETIRASYKCIVVPITKDLSLMNASQELYEEVKKRVEQPVEVLINNAGFGLNGRFLELPLKRQEEMVQVNVTTLVQLTHLFVSDMVKRKSGKVLHTASTAGFQPAPNSAIYYATKAFVISFSDALTAELQGTGVTNTALCPGPTHTNFAATSGHGESVLFKFFPVMTSETIAEAGFEAVMRGDR